MPTLKTGPQSLFLRTLVKYSLLTKPDPPAFMYSDFEEEFTIITASPPPPSPSEVQAAPIGSPIGGKRKFIRGFSVFKREAEKANAKVEPAVADAPAADDSDYHGRDSSSPSLMKYRFGLASLMGTQPLPTKGTVQSSENAALRNDVASVERSFLRRIQAPLLSPLNISPDFRESFQRMVWTLMIIGQPSPPNEDGTAPTPPSIPVIKTTSSYNILVPSSITTTVAKSTLDEYFLRTEVLVRHYTMPYHVAIELASIAAEINTYRFARYMGSRGHWSLRRCFGGLQVLLRWWGATSPHFLKDYATAISLQSPSNDRRTCEALRLEARELLGIHADDEDYETVLDAAITRGFDVIARIRRELQVVIQDAFEDLVERAQKAGMGGHSSTPLSSGH